ncbi:MAG: ABC transporter permease [Treponema sp.]|jgi:lipoprotein-releasing system permease protein|nr:ABC transporter permease [Treponema sp.]
MKRFNFRWILFVAGRYVSRGRRNSPSPVLAILGIGTGVLALIVILAVMNGFQLGFIESILEISSYHLRLEGFPLENLEELQDRLRAIPEIKASVPFREFQGLIRGRREGQQAALIRGLPPDVLEHDAAMKAKIEFEDGSFDIGGDRSILLGAELARRLSVRLGDTVTLFSIAGLLSGAADTPAAALAEEEEEALTDTFTVTGIFRTGFYEYDLSWGFINIKSAGALSEAELVLGVKLKNRWQDRNVLKLVSETLVSETLVSETLAGEPGALKLSSWRDYNRAFFGALRTEKLFMFILVGLIFIVVGLNIFQAQRRAVLERREDIGLLRAVGAADTAVRLVFVWDGAIIGLIGAVSGLGLGLLIAYHISAFFTVLENLVNFFIGIINFFSGLFGAGGTAGEFAIFSPAVFYIKEIPSRIIPLEVFLIFMFGFLSALLAAWFASGKVARTGPAEVLRYE